MDDGRRITVDLNGTWAEIGHTVATDVSEGFRGVAWGASARDVLQRESREPASQTDETLRFACRIADLQCTSLYIFVADRLVRAKYILEEEYQNENHYLTAMDTLKSALELKYGSPDSDDSYWNNDLYRSEPQEWGRAVEVGHLSRYVQWKSDHTQILLCLAGENFETSVQAEYVSLALVGLEKAKDEADLLRDL